MNHPTANKDEHWIDVCRRVLQEGPIKYNGALVDAFTASGVVQLVDGVGEELREKILASSFEKAINVMWKVCK